MPRVGLIAVVTIALLFGSANPGWAEEIAGTSAPLVEPADPPPPPADPPPAPPIDPPSAPNGLIGPTGPAGPDAPAVPGATDESGHPSPPSDTPIGEPALTSSSDPQSEPGQPSPPPPSASRSGWAPVASGTVGNSGPASAPPKAAAAAALNGAFDLVAGASSRLDSDDLQYTPVASGQPIDLTVLEALAAAELELAASGSEDAKTEFGEPNAWVFDIATNTLSVVANSVVVATEPSSICIVATGTLALHGPLTITAECGPALSAPAGALSLIWSGSVSLTGGTGFPAISVLEGGSLTLTGTGTDPLTATGGPAASGVSGEGSIAIVGGDLRALAGDRGASGLAVGGTVISGGAVTARGALGADINGTSVLIHGAAVVVAEEVLGEAVFIALGYRDQPLGNLTQTLSTLNRLVVTVAPRLHSETSLQVTLPATIWPNVGPLELLVPQPSDALAVYTNVAGRFTFTLEGYLARPANFTSARLMAPGARLQLYQEPAIPEPVDYALSVSAGAGGTARATASRFGEGDAVELRLTPEACHRFAGMAYSPSALELAWSEASPNVLRFLMPGTDLAVSVRFSKVAGCPADPGPGDHNGGDTPDPGGSGPSGDNQGAGDSGVSGGADGSGSGGNLNGGSIGGTGASGDTSVRRLPSAPRPAPPIRPTASPRPAAPLRPTAVGERTVAQPAAPQRPGVAPVAQEADDLVLEPTDSAGFGAAQADGADTDSGFVEASGAISRTSVRPWSTTPLGIATLVSALVGVLGVGVWALNAKRVGYWIPKFASRS